jgi:hypothetical protein
MVERCKKIEFLMTVSGVLSFAVFWIFVGFVDSEAFFTAYDNSLPFDISH